MRKILISAFVIILFGTANVYAKQISKQEALEIANKTKEAKAFLKTYGKCDGCVSTYSGGKTALIGCVEYAVVSMCDNKSAKFAKSACVWQVEYWVSDACSFRFPNGAKTRIAIDIDALTGRVLAKNPKLEYIKDSAYCEKDDDCLCISGSGLPFVGCSNFLHGPSQCCGASKCKRCRCINNKCSRVLPSGHVELKGKIVQAKGGCYLVFSPRKEVIDSVFLGPKVLGEDCNNKDFKFLNKEVIIRGEISCSVCNTPPCQMASPFCEIKNPKIELIK